MARVEGERIPAITGIGAAFGRNIVPNSRIDELLGKKSGAVDRMMKITGAGIEERRWVDSPQLESPQELRGPDPKNRNYWKTHGLEIAASDLGVEALMEAANMAGVDLQEIKAIFGGSGSQDLRAVAVASLIQSKLGLPNNIRAVDSYAACPGWLHALKNSFDSLYSPIGEGGPQAAIGAEVISPILSKDRPALFVLFGDASGATVTNMVIPDTGAPTSMAFQFGSDGRLAEELCMPGGGSKYPTSAQTLELDLNTLVMDGEIVAENAVKRMAEASRTAIERAGVQVEDIDWVIPHQANRMIMNNAYDLLMGNMADEARIPYDKMIATVQKYGNTSTASIPTAMHDAYQDGRLKRNHLILVTSFGAGLNYGAAVLPMVGLPRR